MFSKESFARSWYEFKKNKLAIVGLIIVGLIIIGAILAPYIAPFPEHVGKYTNFRLKHEPPGFPHLLGTDRIGRDVLSRILFGYRLSLTLALTVLGISVPVGIVLGLLAGYFGGWVDTIIMRTTDVFLALPPLVAAMAVLAIMPTYNIQNAMFAVAAVWWTWHARLVRGVVSSIKTEEFVLSSKVLGAGAVRIIFKEILPNCTSTIIVKATLDIGFVILVGAGLSFLGLGVQPPKPGLGTMVSVESRYLPVQWWSSVFPGLAILILLLGFNFLGDGLRDMFDVDV